jgi:1-acyl-sn-glycerol-3-phosphate acyltransferase
MKKNLLSNVLFAFIFRPLIWLILGLEIKNREQLPVQGPAILIANHNSHLDTILIMSLYSSQYLYKLKPVANEEYFSKNIFLKWFCWTILQIIPISRGQNVAHYNPLEKVSQALNEGSIVIYYPEGTRGLPEQLGEFKKGIMHLAMQHPNVPIFPIYLQGLGKVLPKGKKIIVPFNVKAIVGEPIESKEVKDNFITMLREKFIALAHEVEVCPR